MVRNALTRSGSNQVAADGSVGSAGYVPSSSSRPAGEQRMSQKQAALIRDSSKRQTSNTSSRIRASLGGQQTSSSVGSVISPRQQGLQVVTPRLIQVSSKQQRERTNGNMSLQASHHTSQNSQVHNIQSLPTIGGSSSSSNRLTSMFSSFRLASGGRDREREQEQQQQQLPQPQQEARETGHLKGGGSAISSRAAELHHASKTTRGNNVSNSSSTGTGSNSRDSNLAVSSTMKVTATGADGKPLVCDKCDGNHPTESCPYFKKSRDNHVDATSRGKGIGSATSALPGANLKNARVVRQPGDGSCLFHSMSYGLKEGTANSLRSEVCAYIVDNPGMKISDTPISDWVRWDSGSSVGDYARRMSRGAWGKY